MMGFRREWTGVGVVLVLLAAAVLLNPGRETTEEARPTSAAAGSETEKEFCSAYAPGRSFVVKGVVAGIGRNAGMPDVARIRIRVGADEYSALLCPEPYLARGGFLPRPGERISVRISLERIGGRTEAVAGSIAGRGRTLRLRDGKGSALWERGVCR